MKVDDYLLDTNLSYICSKPADYSLHDFLEKIGQHQVDDTFISSLITQMCHGLADIHNHGVLHLDIKPMNILIDHSNKIWFTDFGLAQRYPYYLRMATAFTLWWRPPEIFFGQKYDHKADIWALGVTIAELLISYRRGNLTYLFAGKDTIETLTLITKLLGTPDCNLYPEFNKIFSKKKCHLPKFEPNFDFLKSYRLIDVEINLIQSILQQDPQARPSLNQILLHPYFDQSISLIELSFDQTFERNLIYPLNKWTKKENWINRNDWLVFIADRKSLKISDLSFSLIVYLFDALYAKAYNAHVC